MEGTLSGVPASFARLLSTRGLERPDGRALYAYRFSRTEFESLREDLRRLRVFELKNRYGAALFVAFAAEWFRREREGGHWDWIRPLADIGVRYAANDTNGDIRYQEIREIVESGLLMWRRHPPRDGEWILSIVSEAGFPAATIRNHPRIAGWLRKSILLIERGVDARDALASEAWRVNSDNLVRVMIDASVELCTAVVDLRKVLSSNEQGIDPIALLAARRPNWRRDLPFEVEEEDVKSLVEEMLRTMADRSAALLVTRCLRRIGQAWKPYLTIQLTGTIEDARLPGGLRNRLRGESRVRLMPRGELADSVSRPIAALERIESEDGDVWEIRPRR